MDQTNQTGSRENEQPMQDVAYFRIYGLNCPRCAGRVEMALRQSPGVTRAVLEFPDGLAEVTYDPQQVTPNALMLAVQSAGDGGHHRYLAEWLE